jgi:hypothetical protein
VALFDGEESTEFFANHGASFTAPPDGGMTNDRRRTAASLVPADWQPVRDPRDARLKRLDTRMASVRNAAPTWTDAPSMRGRAPVRPRTGARTQLRHDHPVTEEKGRCPGPSGPSSRIRQARLMCAALIRVDESVPAVDVSV